MLLTPPSSGGVDPTGKLALGTAQFGLDYGISNRQGMTSVRELSRILFAARRAGIDTLDTAPAYGVSEIRLGEQPLSSEFAIVTKTTRLTQETVTPQAVEGVRLELIQSLCRLRRSSVRALLVHSVPDLFKPGGQQLVQLLLRIREEGLVEKIGVSVYDPAELHAARQLFAVEVVQLPYNLVDDRFDVDDTLAELAAAGIEVHARSAFLQGLLLMSPGDVAPKFAGVASVLTQLDAEALALGTSRLALLLSHCLSRPELARVVVGINDAAQLEEIVAAARALRSVTQTERYRVRDAKILNPSLWNTL